MKTTQQLMELLASQKLTLGACESFTAGLFCSSAASIPGASRVLKGGFVTYWAQMKEMLAHVPAGIIDTYGVVSAPCAKSMAENSRKILDCSYCVSFTGNAGPDVLEGKPAGLIFCAIASEKGTRVFEYRLSLPRNELREKAVSIMMHNLYILASAEHGLLEQQEADSLYWTPDMDASLS